LSKLNNWIQRFGDLLNGHIVGFRMKKGQVLWIVQLYLSEPKKGLALRKLRGFLNNTISYPGPSGPGFFCPGNNKQFPHPHENGTPH